MSIWNLPVHQERTTPTTGAAGAGRYGLTLTEPTHGTTEDRRASDKQCVDCGSTLYRAELTLYAGRCVSCACAAADAPREACADCELELEVDGSCLTCLAADARETASRLTSEIMCALVDSIENGRGLADAAKDALREALDTDATRVANRIDRSGVEITRAGDSSFRLTLGGVSFTVKVSS